MTVREEENAGERKKETKHEELTRYVEMETHKDKRNAKKKAPEDKTQR